MLRPVLRVVISVALLGGAVTGCGGSGGATAPTTASASSVASPPSTGSAPMTAPPPTAASTTAYAPVTPEPSAPAAAARLVATWQAGDRVSAAEVASPAAVASLFAVPPKGLQARGCSDGAPPVDCTYADRAGAGAGLYDFSVGAAAGGHWYVVAVTVETP